MKVLVYRFSAMGDVALCLPVLKSVVALNSEVEITFVTRRAFAFLFENIPRLNIVIAELDGEHRGLLGLYKLAKKLKNLADFDYICDLHQVMRTQILNIMFLNKKVFRINKERSVKKKFAKKPSRKYLKHTTSRYLDVFKSLGLKVPSDSTELISYGYSANYTNSKIGLLLHNLRGKKLIGIAPFAKHFTKIWPFEYLEELIVKLQNNSSAILLFGGPEDEAKLSSLEKRYGHVINLAGVYNLEEELALMKNLQVMVAMDSANMHFAMLCNVPVVSIWGGTHPGFGFYPLDPRSKVLQVEETELSCRPCSLFGQSSCPKSHFECMYKIIPEKVANAIHGFLR